MEVEIIIVIASLAFGVLSHFRFSNEKRRSKNNYKKLFSSHNDFMTRVAENSQNSSIHEYFNQSINTKKLDENGIPTNLSTPWSNDEYVTEITSQIDKLATNKQNIKEEWIKIEKENSYITTERELINRKETELEIRFQEVETKSQEIENKLFIEKSDLENEKRKLKSEISQIESLFTVKQNRYAIEVEEILDQGIKKSTILSENYIGLTIKENTIKGLNTWVSEQISDIHKEVFENVSIALRTKKHPSFKGSEKVAEMSREVKRIQKDSKLNAYTVRLYEHLFPWLEDFNDVSPSLISKEKNTNSVFFKKEENDLVLTAIESSLPDSEKNQIKLDRYIRSNKSKWEIGILYERYVAHLYINEGWKIYMQGALKGFEDMGRDLIAKKNGITKIIQCKNWSKTKTIHEKHIFQIFGTAVSYFIEKFGTNISGNNYFALFKEFKIIPVFYTSTTLSEQAKLCAELLAGC